MTELTDRPLDVDADLDPDDLSSNPSTAPHFADVVQARMSRRTVLRGGMLAAAGFMTTRLVADTPAAYAAPKGKPGKPIPSGGGLLGFRAIAPSTSDEVVVPAGYHAVPFIPWGTPLQPNGPAFVPGSPDIIGTGNTAAEQEQQVGMHHDGMHFFPFADRKAGRGPAGRARGLEKQASRHGLLVVNHEYTDEFYLHTGTVTEPTPEQYTLEMVRKSQAAHGASVLEVRQNKRGSWQLMPSKLNRRITANTPMTFSGAAAASPLLNTGSPADGRNPVGTINNCAHGYTRGGPTWHARRTSTATSRSRKAPTTRTTLPSSSATASAVTASTGPPTTRASRSPPASRTSRTGSAGSSRSTRSTRPPHR